jgi:hypothetical protein
MSNVYGAENTFFIDEVEETATMQRTACTTQDATVGKPAACTTQQHHVTDDRRLPLQHAAPNMHLTTRSMQRAT